MKKIAFICFDHFQILDLTGPMQVFDSARLSGQTHYQLVTLSRPGGIIKASNGLGVATEKQFDLEGFDSLIVVGGRGVFEACNDNELVEYIQIQSQQVRRTISICTGSFLLSQAGLLAGKKATTHWRYLQRLQQHSPNIRVESDALYVYDGNVITSAGVTAGMDLALSLVEDDIDREVAMLIARNLVIYYHRSGSQQQFSEPLKTQSLEQPIFRSLCLDIIQHPQRDYRVIAMAEQMNMSPRNFSRRFLQEVGLSPGKYVEKIRMDTAKALLEQSQYPIEKIADHCGLSQEVFRRTFMRYFGITPSKHRSHFAH